MRLLDYEVLLSRVDGYGIDDLELYVQILNKNEIILNSDNSFTYNISKVNGAGIRVFKGNKKSFAYTSFSNLTDIDSTIKIAATNSSLKEQTSKHYMPFGSKETFFLEYDETLCERDIKEKKSILYNMKQKACTSDVKITNVPQVVWNDYTINTHLMNSKGVFYSLQRTIIITYISIVATEHSKAANNLGVSLAYFYDNLDPLNMVEDKSLYTIQMLNAEPYSNHKGTIVFSQLAGAKLLKCFWPIFIGKDVFEKRSVLSGLSGKKLSTNDLLLVDQGNLNGGIATSPFDAEGVLTERTELIREGVLTNFLFDYSSAQDYGQKPTGNSMRNDYRLQPKVGPSNFYIDQGKLSFSEILNQVHNGLYVTNIFNLYTGVDIKTGDFSFSAEGYLIKNGEIQSPKKTIISGNFLELVKNISLIGNDLYYDPLCEGFGCPTFVVDNLNY